MSARCGVVAGVRSALGDLAMKGKYSLKATSVIVTGVDMLMLLTLFVAV